MSAESSKRPRIVGNRRGLTADAQIAAWQAPTPAEVAARPPLPEPPPRPRAIAPPPPARVAEHGAATEAPADPEARAPKLPPQPPEAPRPEWIQDGTVQARIWQRPEDAAHVVRGLIRGEAPADGDDLPAMQRVAILSVALGPEICGEVMKFMSDYEIEETTKAVACLKSVSAEMQKRVLAEFDQDLTAGEWLRQGGLNFARAALERAVGPRKAKEFLDRVTATVTSGFYVLKNVAPEQLVPFVSHEHPQTIALILSQLNATQSAGILHLLPEPIQKDVAYRIATLENVTPAVLKALEESIEASLRDLIGGSYGVGGPKVLADIINLTGSSTEKALLDDLDGRDAPLAESVRNLMFVFADIERMTDQDLLVLTKEVAFEDWTVALKASSTSLKDRLQRLFGDERWQQLTAAMEYLGPMRLGEVETVQLRIVHRVRELEEQGKVTIVRGEADDAWV